MRQSRGTAPSLLVLDTSYTLEMIYERGIEKSVLCRDLDGFFNHVWSVHPFATLLTSESWAPRFGPPQVHKISARHTFIEGTFGRFAVLRRVSPLNFLLAQARLFRELKTLIRNGGIKVIRAGDPLYLGLFGLLLARSAGVPLVIRVNGNNQRIRATTGAPLFPRLFRYGRIEERIERFVLSQADMVVAPNQENAEYAVAFGAPSDRVSIFRYGNLLADDHLLAPERRPLDASLFERLKIQPGKYVLSVARLMEVKFVQDVLEAFAEIRASGCIVDLVYAGDGPMRSELEHRAKMLGLAAHVHFIGNQNQHSLAQLNTHAAAVLSPSTGRALCESALGAAPIVAYDIDWQSELIDSGKTGELVPFRRADLLAARTIKILKDRSYAQRLGCAARARALEMLNPSELNEHERREYASLLART